MFLEFTVGNYLSFKDNVTFSMETAAINEYEENKFKINDKQCLLKSAIIYGANASGKSNFFKAIKFMKEFVLSSATKIEPFENISVEGFRLSDKDEEAPSYFEISFFMDSKKYRYGFELNKKRVVKEWLKFTPTIKEAIIFSREFDDIYIPQDRLKEEKILKQKTRKNALFLSVMAQFNGEIATKVVKWFNDMVIVSGLKDNYIMDSINLFLEKNEEKVNEAIINLIKEADTGIENIEVKKELIFGQGETHWIYTEHKKYDEKGKFLGIEKFNMLDNESDGTKKLFALLGPIIKVLKNGNVIFIDEMDSRLHHMLTTFIVKLFHSSNKNKAQLIFAGHDTKLLSERLFRRDQIWFVEKNRYGASDLYSLIEYSVRNNASFEKDYLHGKYGAIPIIDEIDFLNVSDGDING